MVADAYAVVIFTYSHTYFSVYSGLIFLARKACIYSLLRKNNHLYSSSQANMLIHGVFSDNWAPDQWRHGEVTAKEVCAQVPLEI